MDDPTGILLFNRRSGAQSDAEKEGLAVAASKAGLEVVEMEEDLDLPSFVASKRKAGTKLFVAAGGDGSLLAVAQSLVGTEAVLGVIPMGSLNHFARDLKIPLTWSEALEIALSGRIRVVDVGKVNDRYFLNNVFLGIYAKISEYRERYREEMGKWRAYVESVRLALRHFADVELELESAEGIERVRTQMLTVSVGLDDLSTFGLLAPRVALKAGTLHVYWLPFLTRRAFALASARYFLGLAPTFGDFRSLASTRLRLHSPRRRIQVVMDGELAWLRPPIDIAIVPSALRVKTPEPASATNERQLPGR